VTIKDINAAKEIDMLDSRVLILFLVLALIVFGTKRLRSVGSDLGGAIKGFHKSMREAEPSATELPTRDSEDR
jgi:sec-independent protein translocase protein TatA